MAKSTDKGGRCCSFCGRQEREVSKLIGAPSNNVYICDRCIDQCYDLMYADYDREPEIG